MRWPCENVRDPLKLSKIGCIINLFQNSVGFETALYIKKFDKEEAYGFKDAGVL
jgi:hypothetical protein